MARDDERRKTFWDEEEEEGSADPAPSSSKGNIAATSDEISQNLHDLKVLMEQTHQLYQHYFTGLEKRPPIEKVRLLESKIAELQRTSGSTTASRFKVSQFIQNYQTFKELWERKLKNLERK